MENCGKNRKIRLITKQFLNMKEKRFLENYEAPQVEFVEVQVERGFAQSNTEGWGYGEEDPWGQS